MKIEKSSEKIFSICQRRKNAWEKSSNLSTTEITVMSKASCTFDEHFFSFEM